MASRLLFVRSSLLVSPRFALSSPCRWLSSASSRKLACASESSTDTYKSFSFSELIDDSERAFSKPFGTHAASRLVLALVEIMIPLLNESVTGTVDALLSTDMVRPTVTLSCNAFFKSCVAVEEAEAEGTSTGFLLFISFTILRGEVLDTV